MKTKLIIEIETKDRIEVLPEEGQTLDDFKGKQKQKQLKEFQEEFTKEFHEEFVNTLKNQITDGSFEEELIKNFDRFYAVEGFESLKDYKTKINVRVAK